MTIPDTDQAGAGTGARRRRPLLASLTTLGVVTGLLGVAGVFAAGTDTADTGTNDAISGVNGGGGGGDVDLLLAPVTYDLGTGEFTCGDFADDLATGVITSEGEQIDGQYPFPQYDEGYVCVQNVGTDVAGVGLTAFDVVDTDLGCAPNEAEIGGDDSCSEGGVGELSQDLGISMFGATPDSIDPNNCFDQLAGGGPLASIDVFQGAQRLTVFDLAPGETRGVCVGAMWNGNAASQTDQVSWRFRFDAVAGGNPAFSYVCPTADDELEENDTPETATPIAQGAIPAIACDSDADYFVYEHDGGLLNLDLLFDAPSNDLDLYLREADGITNIEAATSTDSEEHLSVELDPGTYVILVDGYDVPDGSTPYELDVSSLDLS